MTAVGVSIKTDNTELDADARCSGNEKKNRESLKVPTTCKVDNSKKKIQTLALQSLESVGVPKPADDAEVVIFGAWSFELSLIFDAQRDQKSKGPSKAVIQGDI